MSGEQTAMRPTVRSGLAKALLIAAALFAIVSGSCDFIPFLGGENAEGGGTQTPDNVVTLTPTAEPVNAGVPGVAPNRIHFGQSADFSGSAAALGQNMRIGIQAAFNEVNDQGGINGRRMELSNLDDLYTPEKAVINTIRLIEELEVFALIGAVGTPTSRAAVPVAQEAGVPYIAPFTGAEFLRDPQLENVLNLRSSYFQETEEMVERLTTDLGITRISILYQDDSFGRAGLQGVLNAMEKRDMELASIGLYQRLTTAVKAALLDIRQGDPQAVIIIGAYQPAAALIKWARHLGMDPVFIAVSFVGSNALAESLGSGGEDVFITQVVPFPSDASLPITQEYLRALERYFPNREPGFVSFEGYLAGRLAIEGVKRCGEDITRECFLESLRDGEPIDLGGFHVQYGQGDNQGSDRVFITRIDENGEFQPVTNMRDAFVQ
ncbi:MAG: ABC transporter substrate-binding protein [Chloroflexi bacterium]|nr:ABC transporter substrate-binding protein [Chloroflexota bacterium]